MERLRLADLQRIADFLKDLYDLADIPAYRERLMRALPTLVPADRVCLIESHPRLKQASGESKPGGAFDGDMAGLYGLYVPQSPLLKAYKRGQGSAVKYSDFLTQPQLRRLGLYNEYLRKLDAEYRIAKGLPGRPGWLTTVQLDRRRRDFSERDRLVLDALGPHLNQSYQNAVAITASRVHVALIKNGVDALDRGLVLLAADRTVEWMSSRACQWLATYFGSARGRDGGLPDPIVRWLRQHTEPSARELPQPRGPLMVTRENTQLVVRLVSRGESTVLVLEEQYRSVPPHALRSLGLTPRETEVLAWVAEGKTSEEIAIILGTGRRGVEKHLERIFPKLGVETRTAAAAQALAWIIHER